MINHIITEQARLEYKIENLKSNTNIPLKANANLKKMMMDSNNLEIKKCHDEFWKLTNMLEAMNNKILWEEKLIIYCETQNIFVRNPKKSN